MEFPRIQGGKLKPCLSGPLEVQGKRLRPIPGPEIFEVSNRSSARLLQLHTGYDRHRSTKKFKIAPATIDTLSYRQQGHYCRNLAHAKEKKNR